MKRIPLTQGRYAIVDDADFGELMKYKWRAVKMNSGAVVAARDGPGKQILMHRQIMSAPKGLRIDHVNHDTLDNRRANLHLQYGSKRLLRMVLARLDSLDKIEIEIKQLVEKALEKLEV